MLKSKCFIASLALVQLMASCAVAHRNERTINSLNFIGFHVLPHKMNFRGTTVGGLSGIDFDSATGQYYLISDDRSDINPARFYTARIFLTEKGIDSVVFVNVTTMRQKNGTAYPNKIQDPNHVPDPEAIRYNPRTGSFIWSSEGERIIKKDTIVIADPAIHLMAVDGLLIDTFQLPGNIHIRTSHEGPRQNGTFEGLTFVPGTKTFLASVEEPLYEDGPRAGLADSSAWIRIIRFDYESRLPLAQYAYRIDPVVHPSVPAGAYKVNGVPEILALNEHQLLVLERSYSTGREESNIRVYLAELNGSDNIMERKSLTSAQFKPLKKRLLVNMDHLGIFTDNIEGFSFGPMLPNGKRSLLFVSDDNFASKQKTQFLLFEVNE